MLIYYIFIQHILCDRRKSKTFTSTKSLFELEKMQKFFKLGLLNNSKMGKNGLQEKTKIPENLKFLLEEDERLFDNQFFKPNLNKDLFEKVNENNLGPGEFLMQNENMTVQKNNFSDKEIENLILLSLMDPNEPLVPLNNEDLKEIPLQEKPGFNYAPQNEIPGVENLPQNNLNSPSETKSPLLNDLPNKSLPKMNDLPENKKPFSPTKLPQNKPDFLPQSKIPGVENLPKNNLDGSNGPSQTKSPLLNDLPNKTLPKINDLPENERPFSPTKPKNKSDFPESGSFPINLPSKKKDSFPEKAQNDKPFTNQNKETKPSNPTNKTKTQTFPFQPEEISPNFVKSGCIGSDCEKNVSPLSQIIQDCINNKDLCPQNKDSLHNFKDLSHKKEKQKNLKKCVNGVCEDNGNMKNMIDNCLVDDKLCSPALKSSISSFPDSQCDSKECQNQKNEMSQSIQECINTGNCSINLANALEEAKNMNQSVCTTKDCSEMKNIKNIIDDCSVDLSKCPPIMYFAHSFLKEKKNKAEGKCYGAKCEAQFEKIGKMLQDCLNNEALCPPNMNKTVKSYRKSMRRAKNRAKCEADGNCEVEEDCVGGECEGTGNQNNSKKGESAGKCQTNSAECLGMLGGKSNGLGKCIANGECDTAGGLDDCIGRGDCLAGDALGECIARGDCKGEGMADCIARGDCKGEGMADCIARGDCKGEGMADCIARGDCKGEGMADCIARGDCKGEGMADCIARGDCKGEGMADCIARGDCKGEGMADCIARGDCKGEGMADCIARGDCKGEGMADCIARGDCKGEGMADCIARGDCKGEGMADCIARGDCKGEGMADCIARGDCKGEGMADCIGEDCFPMNSNGIQDCISNPALCPPLKDGMFNHIPPHTPETHPNDCLSDPSICDPLKGNIPKMLSNCISDPSLCPPIKGIIPSLENICELIFNPSLKIPNECKDSNCTNNSVSIFKEMSNILENKEKCKESENECNNNFDSLFNFLMKTIDDCSGSENLCENFDFNEKCLERNYDILYNNLNKELYDCLEFKCTNIIEFLPNIFKECLLNKEKVDFPLDLPFINLPQDFPEHYSPHDKERHKNDCEGLECIKNNKQDNKLIPSKSYNKNIHPFYQTRFYSKKERNFYFKSNSSNNFDLLSLSGNNTMCNRVMENLLKIMKKCMTNLCDLIKNLHPQSNHNPPHPLDHIKHNNKLGIPVMNKLGLIRPKHLPDHYYNNINHHNHINLSDKIHKPNHDKEKNNHMNH